MRTLARSISYAALASAVMFAAAKGGSGGAAAAAVPPVPANAKFTFDVPKPEAPASARGGQSKYPFDELPAPMPDPNTPGKFLYASFPVTEAGKDGKPKTAKALASTISSANKRSREKVLDTEGKPTYETKTVKGVEQRVEVTKPGKVFKAYDVDPAKDPSRASVRVYREA